MDNVISRVIRKTSAETTGTTGAGNATSAGPSTAKSDARFNVPLLLAKHLISVRDYSAGLVKKTPTLYLIAGGLVSLPFVWLVPLLMLFVVPFWTGVGLFFYGAVVYDWTTTVNHVVVAVEELSGYSLRRSTSYAKPLYDLVISVTLTLDQIIYRLNSPFRWGYKVANRYVLSPVLDIAFGPKGLAWPIVRFYYGIYKFFWKYLVAALKTLEKIGYSTVPTLTAYIVRIVENSYYKAGDYAKSFSDYVPLQLKQQLV
jgi:hypothetical protein